MCTSFDDVVEKQIHLDRYIPDRSCSLFGVQGLRVEGEALVGWNHEWGELSIDPFFYEIFLDTPLAVGLTFKQHPLAVCGFFAHSQDMLFIKQIQGIQRQKIQQGYVSPVTPSEGFSLLDFRKTLVGIVEDIALQAGYTTVGIQCGDQNEYTKEHRGKIPLDVKRSRNIYDKTAQRLGYSLAQDGNWYKEISK
ncbi:MAG: hypothetical protein ACMXYC_00720 [Candidatus Woesearchaeota archaeon]